jgi:predicted TIM-barrel fold metal-dependent hydrolase
LEYPYAETAEGIYYKQLSGGVDVNVAFPFTCDLYCDWKSLFNGVVAHGEDAVSDTPYKVENRVLMREVFDFRPELSRRFIPFVSVDPAREVAGQIRELERLESRYPIYGIKINPVGCQSKALALLDEGSVFLDYAADRDIPFIFHSVTVPVDIYSQAADILRIAERRSALRFSLAHAMIFNKEMLERADAMENVWVDTAALKIQVDLVNRFVDDGLVERGSLISADFADHRLVMRALCEMCPETILWGSDSPAYAFHCVREQGGGNRQDFFLSGKYEDEVDALNSLDRDIRGRVSNTNTLDFLFGGE